MDGNILVFDDNPEHWEWLRTSILMEDGSWVDDTPTKNFQTIEVRKQNLHWSEKYHYLYFTRFGDNQSCTAEVSVEEREWLHKPTNIYRIKREICVQFDRELGTKAGSWKGGVVGCSYEMLPNETPLEAIRRMEKFRNFE